MMKFLKVVIPLDSGVVGLAKNAPPAYRRDHLPVKKVYRCETESAHLTEEEVRSLIRSPLFFSRGTFCVRERFISLVSSLPVSAFFQSDRCLEKRERVEEKNLGNLSLNPTMRRSSVQPALLCPFVQFHLS